MNECTLTSLRRAFVAGWLILALLAGLGHRIWPASPITAQGPLVRLLPHLRYGYVMFSDVPVFASSLHYRLPGEQREQPLAELVSTPAWGYASARATLNSLLYPDYVKHLCSQHGNLPILVKRAYRVNETGRTRTLQHEVTCAEQQWH